MIKIENTAVYGWEPAIRGLRNPMSSWEKSDSYGVLVSNDGIPFVIGPNDHALMLKLAKAGPVHAKYRRMINVTCDITAPLYWWKEFDTYKVGTVANSCSTMYKIAGKEFTVDDFSGENLFGWDDLMEYSKAKTIDTSISEDDINGNAYKTLDYKPQFLGSTAIILSVIIDTLNRNRRKYIETKDKRYWWQMIQLLPTSYNQRRTVQMNYEVLANIYPDRRGHKLDCWIKFCKWIETLPHSELITAQREEN